MIFSGAEIASGANDRPEKLDISSSFTKNDGEPIFHEAMRLQCTRGSKFVDWQQRLHHNKSLRHGSNQCDNSLKIYGP